MVCEKQSRSASPIVMSVADSRRPFRLCDVAVPQSDVRLVSSQDIMGSRSQLKLSSGQQVQIFKGYFAVEGSNCRRKGFLVVGDPGSRPKTGSLSGSQASLADLIQLQKPRTKERSKSAEGLRLPSKPLGSHASLSRLADSPQSDLAGNRESRWSGFRDRVKSAIASPQIGRRNTSGSRTPQRPAGRFVSPSVERKSELDWRPEVPKRTTSLNSLNAEFIAEEDNKSVVETIYAAVQKEKSKDFKQPGDEDNSVRPDLPPRRYSHDAKQSESQENASPKEISPQVDSTSPLSPPPKPPRSILKKKSREEYDWTPAIVPVDLEQIATEDADLSCPPMVQSTLPSDFTVATLTYDIGCLLIPYQTDASQVTETSSSNQPLAIGLLRYFSPIKDVSLPQLLDDSQTLPANIESLQRCESCEDLVASDLIELNSVKSSDIEVEPSIDSAGVELNDVRDEKPTEVEGKDLAPFADNIHFPQESVIADNFDVPEANENLNESSDRLDEPFLPPDLSEKEITEVPVTNIDELMSQLNLINLEDSEALSNESIEEGESSLEDLMARAGIDVPDQLQLNLATFVSV